MSLWAALVAYDDTGVALLSWHGRQAFTHLEEWTTSSWTRVEYSGDGTLRHDHNMNSKQNGQGIAQIFLASVLRSNCIYNNGIVIISLMKG